MVNQRMATTRSKIALFIVLGLILGSAFILLGPKSSVPVVAYFSSAKGIYVGDDVTLLGVPVGTVTSITPGRDNVRIDLKIDDDVPIPKDVRAAITAPALVTVRSVALGPVYDGGRRLVSGDTIPISRTTVPVEWDESKKQLTRLAAALGPKGKGKGGSLGNLVSAGATFMDGNGAQVRQTVVDLSEAMATLADNKGDLFATVRNLQVFVAALEGSDREIRSFNRELDVVSGSLNDDRRALGDSLEAVRHAFEDVEAFLRKNTDLSRSTLEALRSTTSLLASNRQELADVLQLAPTSISNFYNIIDPRIGAPTGALALGNLRYPAQIVCAALLNLGGDAQACQSALGPLVNYLKIDGQATPGIPTPPSGTGGAP